VTQPVFPRPATGWVGDVIPYVQDGRAVLAYLRDERGGLHSGMSWDAYATNDFSSFEDLGVVLPQGTEAEPDFNCYTGSIVEADGLTHIFYTGYNDTVTVQGQASQLVMHASTSRLGDAVVKHPEHSFGAPDGYEAADFRDPFVFRPAADGPWHMLVIARRARGADRRRGVILDFESADLKSWTFRGEFWAPGRYIAVECPEVFPIGEHWYLVYSEFSERFATRYRVGPTPFGPWTVPEHDTIDGRAFYAAKSLVHDGVRYFAGWIPTKEGETDDGGWEWAGHLAVHAARPADDGSLLFSIPDALADSFRNKRRLAVGSGDAWSADVPDGLAVAVDPDAPDQFLLDVTIDIAPGTVECGVVLHSSDDGSEGYVIRLEPRRNRMVFDRWPRRRTGEAQWQISGDVPFAVELERSVALDPGAHRLRVLVDGTACVAYLDDVVAMSARMYDRRFGGVGLFVGEGRGAFSDMSIATR
jgi:beta-fructofuranosidase